MSTEEEVRAALVDVAAAAWDEGCPVAGQAPEQFQQTADTAWRRWQSMDSRHRKPITYEQRVEDLAEGLRDAFETNPAIVGRLMEDYRYLAGRRAQVLDPT